MPFSSSGPDWGVIPGLNKVKLTLESFISSGRIPQAIILSGKAGIGKDFLAATFAAILNKRAVPEQPFSTDYLLFIFELPAGKGENSDDDPYQKLSPDNYSLVQEAFSSKNENPYYTIDLPVAASIKINSIRLIGKFLSLRTFTDDVHRVVLISGADKMGDAAQNALLKNLEEPPPQVTFILTTDSPGNLKETIRSRCWELSCPPLEDEEVFEVLTRYFGFEEEESRAVVPLAEGSPYFAAGLLRSNFNELVDVVFEYLRHCLPRHYFTSASLLTQYEFEKDSQTFLLFLRLIRYWCYDLEYTKIYGKCRYFPGRNETFIKFLGKFPDVTTQELISYLDELEYKITQRNALIPACLFNLTVKISEIITPINTKV